MKIVLSNIIRLFLNILLRIFLWSKYLIKQKDKVDLKVKRILLINVHGIGDLIMFTPVLQLIKNQYPEAEIDIVVKNSAAPLFIKDHRVNQVISFETKRWWLILKQIRRNYDITTIFQGGILSSIFLLFIKSVMVTGMVFNTPYSCIQVGINLRFKKWKISQEIHLSDLVLEAVKPYIKLPEHVKYSLNLGEINYPGIGTLIKKPFIVFAPESGWKLKDIPSKLIKTVACELVNRNNTVVILGSKKVAQKIDYSSGRFKLFDLRGETSLNEGMAFIKNAEYIITADSAFMHAAATFNVSSIVLFGPTDPEKLVPRMSTNFTIYKKLYCSPCYKFLYVPRCVNPHYKACMDHSVADILDQIDQVNRLKKQTETMD